MCQGGGNLLRKQDYERRGREVHGPAGCLGLQVDEVAVSSSVTQSVSVTWDTPSGTSEVWSICTARSLRAHSSVKEKRNRKHPAVKKPREQRGLTLMKKQGLGLVWFS